MSTPQPPPLVVPGPFCGLPVTWAALDRVVAGAEPVWVAVDPAASA